MTHLDCPHTDRAGLACVKIRNHRGTHGAINHYGAWVHWL